MGNAIRSKLYDLSEALDKHVLRCEGVSAAFVGLSQFTFSGEDPMFNGVDLFVQELIKEAKQLSQTCDEARELNREEEDKPPPIENKTLLVRDIIPEWREEGRFETDRLLGFDYMDDRGFTNREVATLYSDPRIVAMAVDGWRWRDSLAKARSKEHRDRIEEALVELPD